MKAEMVVTAGSPDGAHVERRFVMNANDTIYLKKVSRLQFNL